MGHIVNVNTNNEEVLRNLKTEQTCKFKFRKYHHNN